MWKLMIKRNLLKPGGGAAPCTFQRPIACQSTLSKRSSLPLGPPSVPGKRGAVSNQEHVMEGRWRACGGGGRGGAALAAQVRGVKAF